MFRDLMGKQGFDYDNQYDWVIKKAGGKQPSHSSIPAQRTPPAEPIIAIQQQKENVLPGGRPRGSTADALIQAAKAAAAVEERKENRMMMG